MYKKQRKGWLKHADFIIIDAICLQLAFVTAYTIRHGLFNPYSTPMYRNMGAFLLLVNIVSGVFGNFYSGILKRGYYVEATSVFKQLTITIGLVLMYMFWTQQSTDYSRLTFGYLWVIGTALIWAARCFWKSVIRKVIRRKENARSLLIVCPQEKTDELVQAFEKNNYENIRVNKTATWEEISKDYKTVLEELRTNWVDEALIDKDYGFTNKDIPENFISGLLEMGITVHVKLSENINLSGKQIVEDMAGYTVMTGSVSIASTGQMMAKRAFDIVGGLIGSIVTLLMLIIVTPIIKIKSPGPVLFKQKRVGKNGKQFTLYKFRSMYVDAEKHMEDIKQDNELESEHMFKLKEDPRIIKGVGSFIRKYSIDEFPQFYNVLIGDMSLVGTRPPTVDEWNKYELHHRKRLAIKPGMTGLWQVSGRSSIKDFEEVVALDTKYIINWSIGLDLRILFKTIAVVLKGDGAM